MGHLFGSVIRLNVTRLPFGLLNGIAALRTGVLLFPTSTGGRVPKLGCRSKSLLVDRGNQRRNDPAPDFGRDVPDCKK
jgi:hypothetical protein